MRVRIVLQERVKYSKKEEMIMSVTAIKSFPASSYKTIPMQENSAYSGGKQSGTENEKKTNMKQKKESVVWEDALTLSIYSGDGAAKRSVGTSAYTKVRHMVYKQNMLERRAELLKNSKASEATETKAAKEVTDSKQEKLMKNAVQKYVVSETYVRLPDTGSQDAGNAGKITTLFGNYNVDKTYSMKLTTVDVQC